MAQRYVLLILVIFALAGLPACGPSSGNTQAGSGTISNPESEMYKPAPLLWEGQTKDGMLWSAFTYHIIGAEAAPALLPGTEDIAEFCPAYSELAAPQRVNFWAYLVSAIAKFESGFNVQARQAESEMDPVTGQRVYAEGLLKLAYRDVRTFAFCAFDYEKDRGLPENDQRRSILDPLKNLDCGIKIMATQVEALKAIASAGNYWKSLRPSAAGSKVKEIKTAARALPFCKK